MLTLASPLETGTGTSDFPRGLGTADSVGISSRTGDLDLFKRGTWVFPCHPARKIVTGRARRDRDPNRFRDGVGFPAWKVRNDRVTVNLDRKLDVRESQDRILCFVHHCPSHPLVVSRERQLSRKEPGKTTPSPKPGSRRVGAPILAIP